MGRPGRRLFGARLGPFDRGSGGRRRILSGEGVSVVIGVLERSSYAIALLIGVLDLGAYSVHECGSNFEVMLRSFLW